MPEGMITALIAAGSATFGALVAGGTNYLVARRALSRSAARLLADLQILEKAKVLQLEESSIQAIEARVRETLKRHTDHAMRRAHTRSA